MIQLAVAFSFAQAAGAARVQIDTADAGAAAGNLTRLDTVWQPASAFPNPCIITNADSGRRLYADNMHLSNPFRSVGAADSADYSTDQRQFDSNPAAFSSLMEQYHWVIEEGPDGWGSGGRVLIKNAHNNRRLFQSEVQGDGDQWSMRASDDSAVGATVGPFQSDQLWEILTIPDAVQEYEFNWDKTPSVPADDSYRRPVRADRFVIMHSTLEQSLHARADAENGRVGWGSFRDEEKIWPDQTWYIEDRADHCRDAECASSDPGDAHCLLPPVPPAAAQPVSFPDPVLIASIMHSNRALYALTSADGEHEGLGAAVFWGQGPYHRNVGQRFFWVIEQHQGGSAFTICNPHSSRCLFATDQGVVGAAEGSFRGDDQLWIIRATSDPFGILERPAVYTITNKASGQRLFADEYDSRNEQTHDEQGWGTASTGREDQIWLIQNWCEGREPLNCVETE